MTGYRFISGSQYNPELSIALDATGSHTSMWVQFMFVDEACVCCFLALRLISNANIDFHCVMAMCVTVLNSLLIKQEDPPEAIRHLSQTFRLFGLPNGLRREDENQKLPVLYSRLLRQMSADLQILLIDITDLAWLVNDASAKDRPKLNGFPFHDNLLLLGYRLIYTSPLGGPRPISHVENVVHLGLTAFIITFLRGFDRQIPDIPILADLARAAAQENFDNEQENQEVLLWTLFIGAASIFRQPHDAWLIPKTTRAMHALDLDTWEDVVRTLVKFPWVNAVHDKAGQALWHRSNSHYRPPSEITSE